MPIQEVLHTFDICKGMVLEVCDCKTDEEVAQFLITAVKDRVSYLKQEPDDGDYLDATYKQGAL
jgi:hypothetical protein